MNIGRQCSSTIVPVYVPIRRIPRLYIGCMPRSLQPVMTFGHRPIIILHVTNVSLYLLSAVM
jgi:hypothetical protein